MADHTHKRKGRRRSAKGWAKIGTGRSGSKQQSKGSRRPTGGKTWAVGSPRGR